MSKIGCKYPCFAPITSDTSTSSLPTYSTGAEIGQLVSANVTLQNASGKLYANDDVVESVDEFMTGTVAMETDDMEDSAVAVVHGCTVSSGEVVDNSADAAPYGGLAYYKTMLKDGVRKFQCYFYPKVKAMLTGDNAATKAGNVTFQNTGTSFEIFKAKNGDWRRRETFLTESAAIAWIQSKIAIATWYKVTVMVQGSGISADKDGINYVAAGGSITITVTGTPTKVYDNGAEVTLTAGAYTISTIAAHHEIAIVKTA